MHDPTKSQKSKNVGNKGAKTGVSGSKASAPPEKTHAWGGTKGAKSQPKWNDGTNEVRIHPAKDGF